MSQHKWPIRERFQDKSLFTPFVSAVRQPTGRIPSNRLRRPRVTVPPFSPAAEKELRAAKTLRRPNAFHNLHCTSLSLINTSNVVLLPKKDGAEAIPDFRPISLIHSFIKIITKVLAMRLAPHMKNIVSHSQSAFIKQRSIHDNFMTVRNMARRYHRQRIPALFFKLDIAKAFDSVRWDYMLDLLQRLGFPIRWRDWIASLFYTSSSRILLNGVPNSPIKHNRGLRQGDPLSPLLFVIAIEPLRALLE